MISVIVPVYNVEKYLSDCINSILKQSFQNFELILVNDGSTDKSAEICDYYAKTDSRIKVFHQKNQGVAAARTFGITKSKFQYICFIDSDDSIANDYLEVLYSAAKKNNADYVCCNAKNENAIDNSFLISEEKNIENFDEVIDAFIAKQQYPFVIWGKLFSKKIIKDVEFAPIKYGEDTLFVMTALSKAEKGYLLPYQGYNYRDNPFGAMSTAKKLQYAMDVLYSISEINKVAEGCSNNGSAMLVHRYEQAIYSTFSSYWDGNKVQRKVAFERLVKSCQEIDFSKCCDSRKKYILIFRRNPFSLLYVIFLRNKVRRFVK
ncbi:MAG: glycosyltransferase family 2 protein [Pseudobutyrivibrio sp.]|uniref:glycosyltransferase family 2 protein n=1 Tax=Pseudobutyrivibrio sp. TaxID=2014367 RepID=UPI0025D6E7EC|nr:glycosyltransferase family 2 protein [Pseudobutyrivibrio sp.]MBQ6464333.1 glycosyltransferase family 2 protein [Pseudobutyrivibrio sp.]